MDDLTKEMLADLDEADNGGLDDAYADSLELEIKTYGNTIELDDLDVDFDPLTGEVGDDE